MVVRGGDAYDFVELLQLTPRYQTTYWSSVSQESVNLSPTQCFIFVDLKYQLNVHRQIKQQPVTIASVVSIGNVSVNHQSSIMVRYRWCIGRQSASIVQPRPLAFPRDTRYLSTNTWWTLLLVQLHISCGWFHRSVTKSRAIFMYSRLSLNGHLYKMDTSLKRTPRVGPCLSLLPLFDSL